MVLKDAVRAIQQDLVMTMQHEAWMRDNPDHMFSPKAIAFMEEQMLLDMAQERAHTERAHRGSSVRKCKRQRVFYLEKWPASNDVDSKLSSIFMTGKFLHLRWQMMGIDAGWLPHPEVPFRNEALRMSGTLDGVLHDGSGLEIKSINDWGFKNVMKNGPKQEHIDQTHHYMILSGIRKFSAVYENKNDGEWREFIIFWDEERVERILKENLVVDYHLNTGVLPEMLQDCQQKLGTTYRQCPYRNVCPTATGTRYPDDAAQGQASPQELPARD